MTALRSTEIDNPLMELIRSSQLLAVPEAASVFWDGIGVVDNAVDEGWEQAGKSFWMGFYLSIHCVKDYG